MLAASPYCCCRSWCCPPIRWSASRSSSAWYSEFGAGSEKSCAMGQALTSTGPWVEEIESASPRPSSISCNRQAGSHEGPRSPRPLARSRAPPAAREESSLDPRRLRAPAHPRARTAAPPPAPAASARFWRRWRTKAALVHSVPTLPPCLPVLCCSTSTRGRSRLRRTRPGERRPSSRARHDGRSTTATARPCRAVSAAHATTTAPPRRAVLHPPGERPPSSRARHGGGHRRRTTEWAKPPSRSQEKWIRRREDSGWNSNKYRVFFAKLKRYIETH